MKTSDKIDALAPDYIAAQADLKNATFDKVNPHFKSRYATLAQVRDTITPVLAKHGLAILQGSLVNDAGVVITTRLLHKSGQWIESSYPFAIGKPQEMGSAMTYARRYGLSAICNIASEEDDDGNEGQKSEGGKIAPMPPTHIGTKAGTIQDKDALCNEINNIASLAVLQAWPKKPDIVERLNALHPDHADIVRNSYVERQHELKAAMAA